MGCGSISRTVTSSPRVRHVAAISAPMNPAPITTTLGRESRSSRSASASSSVLNVNNPARFGCCASRRGVAPVAITKPSNATRSPSCNSTAWSSRCSATARASSRQSSSRSSTPCLRNTTWSGSQSPRSSSFERGGRSYGSCGSAPIATMRPSKPSRRKVSAARNPASEVPTIATVRIARRTYQLAGILTRPSYLRPLAPRHGVCCMSRSLPSVVSPPAADVDVSGRALHLRDVDIDAFLHPRTIAVIGASESSAKPNTAMTRKFEAWATKNGAKFYPVHPERDTVLGQPCYKSVFDVPGEIDLAIILTGRAEATFEEVLQRKAKFAVIFAAGFSETGAEGKKREEHLTELVRGGDV